MAARKVVAIPAGQRTAGGAVPAGSQDVADGRALGAAGGLLLVGMAMLVLLGAWGLLAPRGDGHAGHPQVGDLVDFDGGVFSVDAMRDVDLSAPMSGPAMQMGPTSGVPDIPDGFRWLSVDLTVTAGDAGFEFDPGRFVVTGIGVGRAEPVSVDDGGTIVPALASLTRSFSYQVPEETAQLELWAPGAGDPVMLQLGDAPDAHGH